MLKGKWALVTGATAGLGLAVAESLAGAGANIVLHDLVEPKETRDRLRARFGVEVVSIAADLSQRAAIETMMADLLGRLGAIDILVNNAVVRHFVAGRELPAGDMGRSARRQSVGAVPPDPPRTARHEERGWGRIINMASIYSTRAVADRIDYVTTKTAILGMTRAVAMETTTHRHHLQRAVARARCRRRPSRNKIAGIAAREGRAIEETTSDYLASRQPTGRFVAMEAVGAMAVFLCSQAAQDITGATLPIDGGWSIA